MTVQVRLVVMRWLPAREDLLACLIRIRRAAEHWRRIVALLSILGSKCARQRCVPLRRLLEGYSSHLRPRRHTHTERASTTLNRSADGAIDCETWERDSAQFRMVFDLAFPVYWFVNGPLWLSKKTVTTQ